MGGLRTDLRARYPGLPARLLETLSDRYGTLTAQVLRDAQSEAELGTYFGAGLYAREVDYLIDEEWACNAGDVLWRRTKAGLRLSAAAREAVEQYIQLRRGARVS